jgi:hypothetical protein
MHALPPPQAYKNREEAYTLLWPEKAEFVRMAAKFGATIVPFAAIGADEGVTQVRGLLLHTCVMQCTQVLTRASHR